MNLLPQRSSAASAPEEAPIVTLYHDLLLSWNTRDARAFAACFTEEGNVIGFDGSQMNGRLEIAVVIGQIFTEHTPTAFIAKIREVRFLSPAVAVLRAVVGMVPQAATDIDPAVNAIQMLVAVQSMGTWRSALFQSTPAQFHSRPTEVAALTAELRQLL